MKILYSWLRELVELDLPAEKVAELLCASGIEVAACTSLSRGLEDVVAVKLLEVRKHPNADKLSLVKVVDQGQELQIVCGANNIQSGDLVPLARVGAKLPNGLHIQKSKIRGEVSCGMLCSEAELGFKEESEGILLLPPETPEGAPLAQVLRLDDWLIEVEISPNRGDCLSVLGIAREIAARTGKKVILPTVRSLERIGAENQDFRLEVKAGELCPLYCGGIVTQIRIEPSPEWLQRRLTACGLRPVNNVVDVTNYVMLELGQPLHAFDFSLLRERKIVVRQAQAGEKITTLDGAERPLLESDLVIADGERPVALAGVMGGQDTEIHAGTSAVFLEGAVFDPASVRKTSKRLGLCSESSYRFERGVDPQITPRAVRRAADLLGLLAGGKAAAEMLEVEKAQRPALPILLRVSRVNRLLGKQLPMGRIADLLASLGVACDKAEEGNLICRVPTWRQLDLTREIDLIEEVARLDGYDGIAATLPACQPKPQPLPRPTEVGRRLRPALGALGFAEALNYVFSSEADHARFCPPGSEQKVVTLQNPVLENQPCLRASLLPGLVRNLALNLAQRRERIALYELGRTFEARPGALPLEREQVALLLWGKRGQELWEGKGTQADFYDLKRAVEVALPLCGIERWTLAPGAVRGIFHPGLSARLLVNQEIIGELGACHPRLAQERELPPFLMAELDLERIFSLPQVQPRFQALPQFPDAYRDVALIVAQEVPFADLEQAIRKLKNPLLAEIHIFDQYCGPQIPAGKKSLAFRLRYRSPERTLTDQEVETLHQQVIRSLVQEFGAEARSA